MMFLSTQNAFFKVLKKYYCYECGKEKHSEDKYVASPYERTRNAVYATGNKWAIENFNLTH